MNKMTDVSPEMTDGIIEVSVAFKFQDQKKFDKALADLMLASAKNGYKGGWNSAIDAFKKGEPLKPFGDKE